MTHTLYRSGTPESQSEEICWLAYSTKGVNDDNFPETARHLLKAVEDSGNVANWGDTKIGTILTMPAAEIKENCCRTHDCVAYFPTHGPQ